MYWCQCPLGLIPHFYVARNFIVRVPNVYCVNALSGLYLISTDSEDTYLDLTIDSVNALSGLYLISTYPFKNLGFMRFPEPVFAGIYQNILTTAVFRAC